MDELKKTLALKAVVLRDGSVIEIQASEIVPGDILHIEEVKYLSIGNLLTTGADHSRGR